LNREGVIDRGGSRINGEDETEKNELIIKVFIINIRLNLNCFGVQTVGIEGSS
jgi:hypothetical protein